MVVPPQRALQLLSGLLPGSRYGNLNFVTEPAIEDGRRNRRLY